MIDSAELRKAREDVLAAPADRRGCIRIRRNDILDMLDLIAAQDDALDTLARKAGGAAPLRFADRIRITAPAATPRKRGWS